MTRPRTPRKFHLSKMLGTGQLTTAVAALGVAGFILLGYQFISLRQTLTADVTVHAAIMADNIAASLMFRDSEAATEMLRSFRPAPFLQEAAVFDRGGKIFAWYRRDGAAAPVPSSGSNRSP
ncbi:hypothetical protein G4G28_18630 [Massilia sp. Dwa41.01b]|uniref:CHASE sensor domain-containing protein n=1 Tax=Massilia sp. Dwa41.01b TaxID=2709302 RepID=UPI00160203E5|nr:CHASE sensor domain-containing protein [Massilia sp. Dwa41.01b]QNA90009.1 hypothetical protein G4G28_18630 [Massilia sp. Dwa41.01b]